MKCLNFIILFLSLTQLFAQKIRVEDNRLTVDGVLWCTISEKSHGVSPLKSMYFKGTDGKTWLEAHHVDIGLPDTALAVYKLTFPTLNKEIYYQPGIGMKRTLGSQLVKSGAFTKTGPYEEGIDKFNRNFGYQLPEKKIEPIKQDAQHKVTIVERNRSAGLFVVNGEVKQDFKLVATYQEAIRTENGIIMNVVTFLDVKGIQIAQASFENVNGETANVYINENPNPMIINLNRGTNPMKIEEIAKQLIAIGKM